MIKLIIVIIIVHNATFEISLFPMSLVLTERPQKKVFIRLFQQHITKNEWVELHDAIHGWLPCQSPLNI